MLTQNRKNCLRYILEQKHSYVCQSDREELHCLHLHENSLYIAAIKSQQKNIISWGGGGDKSLMNAATCYLIKNRNLAASLWILVVI